MYCTWKVQDLKDELKKRGGRLTGKKSDLIDRNNKDIQLSKSLSWLLRHGAVREGFRLSPEGYLDVNKILLHKTFRGKYNTSDIERVVKNNDKQRFKLRHNPSTNCLEIKANQGHTITEVSDTELTAITQPIYNTVIHGTYLKCWPHIKNEGLSHMKRKHIHLAKGTLDDASVISGFRWDAEVHIYIDLAGALADGIKFYESENGVILTSGNEKGYLEPKYFAKAVNILTGYPNYTQPQDLLEVFTKFGNVRIDKCNSWSSTLTFSSEQDAAAAVAAHKRLHIYGHYLAVRNYSAKLANEMNNPQPTTPKREFPMSKQKGVIVEPKKIDLSGDFHSQLDSILSAVRLTQEDVKCLGQLYTDLEIALQSQWPGCKAVPFGSITTGLGIKTSDADCFINIPGQFRQPNGNYVNKAKRVLMQYGSTFAEILAIPRANTPIVKFFHIPTETNCDVTFKTPLGAQNSRLIAFLLHSDPRLLPMSVFIKYWAKVHELSGTGKLTNYALTLMIIFYLQQPPHSILPAVAWLQRDAAHAYVVDHWNTGFMNTPALLPPSSNTSSISELLGGFYEYYSLFNFDEMVICPYLGVPIKRELFVDTTSIPDEFDRYKNNVLNHYVMPIRFQTPFVVQDPFEQCHNVASTITSKLAIDIKTYFKFCANAYEKEKLNSCHDFLKIVLLQRPKLIRGKTHPEFRVNLFPRIVNPIITFDWKSVVRDMVMEIFENMLKIKLGKVEEKVNPDTRKEKEKYSGTITKPIWKRKVFNKLYSVLNLSFEEKQAKITQEIMNSEKQDINVQFQLTLTYCHDPKSAVISIRLGSGDLDAFREFGKFFISVTQNWLTELLKPFSMPNCKDTATKIAETMEENNGNEIDSDDDDDSEVVLLPRTGQAVGTPATNNTEQTSKKTGDASATSIEQTLKNTSIETLAKNTNDILTISERNLSGKATTEVLKENTELSSIKNTETMTKNVENFFKNAESLSTTAASTDI